MNRSRVKAITICVFGALLLGLVAVAILRQSPALAIESEANCRDNLHQIYLGLMNHQAKYNILPSGVVINDDLPPEKRWSWIASVLSFLEANGPKIPDISRPWDDKSNRYLLAYDENNKPYHIKNDSLGVMLCPSESRRVSSNGYGLASYIGIAGLGVDAARLASGNARAGIFGYRKGIHVDQIADGVSTTMAIVESTSAIGPWRAAGVSTLRGLDPSRQPYVGINRQFGGLHQGGALVLFADGGVRLVSDKVNPGVFEAASTIAGGERIAPNVLYEGP